MLSNPIGTVLSYGLKLGNSFECIVSNLSLKLSDPLKVSGFQKRITNLDLPLGVAE